MLGVFRRSAGARAARHPAGQLAGRRRLGGGDRTGASVLAAVASCRAAAKEGDFEHWLAATMLMPKAAQAAVLVTRAFNLETSALKDRTSEPAIGAIRIQWWRDAVRDIFERREAPPMPTARALLAVVSRHGLSREHFDCLLDARQEDLNEAQPEELADLEGYAASTSGALALLAVEALAGPAVARGPAALAALDVGKAEGIVQALRGTPHHVEHGGCYVPRALAEAHGVSTADLRNPGGGGPENLDNMRGAVHALAVRAHELVGSARELAAEVPAAARPALAGTASVEMYLAALQARNYDVFHPELRTPTRDSPFPLQARLLWRKWRNTY